MSEVHVRNPVDFETFLTLAKRGDRVIYHRGYLPFDMRGGGEEVRKLAEVAKLASNRGHAALLQRRLGEADYEYLAVRC
jgi:hypothetical protein